MFVKSVDIQDNLLKNQCPGNMISFACGSSCGAPRVDCRASSNSRPPWP